MPHAARSNRLQVWSNRLEQYRTGQQSVQQFCNSIGCSAATFYYWKRQLALVQAPGQSKPAGSASAFVPLNERSCAHGLVRVRAVDGTRVVVPSDALAALEIIVSSLSIPTNSSSSSPMIRSSKRRWK